MRLHEAGQCQQLWACHLVVFQWYCRYQGSNKGKVCYFHWTWKDILSPIDQLFILQTHFHLISSPIYFAKGSHTRLYSSFSIMAAKGKGMHYTFTICWCNAQDSKMCIFCSCSLLWPATPCVEWELTTNFTKFSLRSVGSHFIHKYKPVCSKILLLYFFNDWLYALQLTQKLQMYHTLLHASPACSGKCNTLWFFWAIKCLFLFKKTFQKQNYNWFFSDSSSLNEMIELHSCKPWIEIIWFKTSIEESRHVMTFLDWSLQCKECYFCLKILQWLLILHLFLVLFLAVSSFL